MITTAITYRGEGCRGGDGVKGASVVITGAPTIGPNVSALGCNDFFEVKITQPNTIAFMSLFNFSSVNVAAGALAGTPGGSTA